MSTDSDHRNLPATLTGTGLSVGAVALGLQIAARNALTPEEAKTAVQEHLCLFGFSEECVRLAVKKPPGWPYRLFLHVLKEHMRRLRDLKPPTVPDNCDPSFPAKWIVDRREECRSLQEGINEKLDTDLVRAIGNEPGDASETAVVYLAIQVSEVLCNFTMIRKVALGMQQRYGSHQPMLGSFAAFCEQCIFEFRQYPDQALNTVMNTLASGHNDLQTAVRMDLPVLRKDPESAGGP